MRTKAPRGVEQEIEIDRLGNKPGNAEILRLYPHVRTRRKHHHRDRLQLLSAALLRQKLPPVHARHHQVEQNQAWQLRAGSQVFDRLDAIAHPQRRIAFVA